METQTKQNKGKKIDWKKLMKKSLEEGIKKAIEVAVIILVVGATMEVVLISIPAVMVGTVIAKAIKLSILGD